jgi:hypothetical protein
VESEEQDINTDKIYYSEFDVSTLSEAQRIEYNYHFVDSTLPIWAAVVSHILSLGIFSLIYYGIMHSKFPLIKKNDFDTPKAIGFMFIPLFNLYWTFRFWEHLGHKINLQYKLRNEKPPIENTFIMLTVASKFGHVIGFAISYLVLYPIMIARIQRACNTLAEEHPYYSE